MKQKKSTQALAGKSEKKPAYHHGDLPKALIAAAMHLIEQTGEPLSLRGAAVAAGVSVAAPYRHFESREALLAAVLAEGFRELTRCTEEARHTEQTPLKALVATGVAYVQFAADRPRLYRLMFGPECGKAEFPDLMQAGCESLRVLNQAVADARTALGVAEEDIAHIALTGWSLTHGLASLYVDGLLVGTCSSANLQAITSRMVETLIDGLRPRPAKTDEALRN